MAATRLIPLHVNKGKTVAQCLADRTDYSENAAKTNDGEFISSYMCDPKSCDQEFLLSKREYLHKVGHESQNEIIAYQIRQSFKPGEVTPEEANKIGYELAESWTKGKHAFIVATHVDRAHIHNHIIYNSTNLECNRKYRNFLWSSIALQRVSDIICIQHGLSTIEAAPYGSRKKYEHNFAPSLRDEIRRDIDEVLSGKPARFEDFLFALKEKEYEIHPGKRMGIRKKGKERFLRFDSLGEQYSVEAIRRSFETGASQEREPDFKLVLDIQKIIAKNKGANYERWAKRFNLKQTAKALCFIQEHGIKTMAELTALADGATAKFDALTASMKAKQQRLDQITELKKAIADYYRVRDCYTEYRNRRFSKKYYEEHRSDLQLYAAAKKVFDKYHLKKLPKIKDLNEEFSKVLEEKRREYAEYRQAKAHMQEYLIAKQNIEALLNSENEAKKEHEKAERSEK